MQWPQENTFHKFQCCHPKRILQTLMAPLMVKDATAQCSNKQAFSMSFGGWRYIMGILFVFMVILHTRWVFTFRPLFKTFNSLHNATMSEVRVAVEWLFGNITNYFKFIDFKSQLQINLSSVGKFYIVCALWKMR